MTTEIRSDYRIAAGETLAIRDSDGVLLFEAPGLAKNTLTVDGQLLLNIGGSTPLQFPNTGGAVGIYARAADVLISGSGTYRVEASSGLANGYYNTEGGRSVLMNQGLYEVRGVTVTGVWAWGGLRLENSGTFRVIGDWAQGADLHSGGTFNNTGIFEILSPGGGFGVRMDGFFSHFTNTGALTVSGPGAVAVQWNAEGDFTNSGLISGDYALKAQPYADSLQTIDNSGTLRGRLDLGSGSANLRNTGLIQGEVQMGAGADTYAGSSGHLVGDLHGGAGADSLAGGGDGDRIFGDEGNDVIAGGRGADLLDGGSGLDTVSFEASSRGATIDLAAGFASDGIDPDVLNGFENVTGSRFADTITGSAGQNYLRGGDGADLMAGGAEFDDMNGNVGDDTAAGGSGDDWVVGGKDNDWLQGESGDDIVYGNLGADNCDGGDGADLVRGGQGDDTVVGSSGNDWLSGDRGDDTITGGAGADIFHGSQDAGIDRVTDFSAAQGDRVQLDPGTTYSVSQSGADTVIDMGGANRMVLVGIQMTSLPTGWIFGA